MSRKKCNPCTEVTIVSYNRWSEEMLQKQELKRLQPRLKITTYCYGTIKNNFITDCKRTGLAESEVARKIFAIHYAILTAYPELIDKSIDDIMSFVKR
ncbi:MAG: hypothetical protein ABI241_00545 [Bacteroidia bacterium]